MSSINKNWNQKLSTDWVAIVFLLTSPIVALIWGIWYIHNYGVHIYDVLLFVVMYLLSGLGVTAGYHRYYAHRTHEAHPILQVFYLFFGAISMQQGALQWARNHRIHHRYSDTELDPHNIKEGFFHAHMGWIFYRRRLDSDFSSVKDLLKDKLVLFQRKYYWVIFALGAIALPIGIGYLYGSPMGAFVWAGLFRIVIQNHMTYFVNSYAHTWGKQRFSLKYEARDSWLLALLTNGEGFHSFHHRFAFDYRNGWRWYQWDPSKWFIRLASYVGLASNLKTASEESILKARVSTDRLRLRSQMESMPSERRQKFEQKIQEAHKHLESVLQRWQETKEKLLQYKELRKRQALEFSRTEYENLKQKLRDQKRDCRLAQRQWALVITSISLFVR